MYGYRNETISNSVIYDLLEEFASTANHVWSRENPRKTPVATCYMMTSAVADILCNFLDIRLKHQRGHYM